MNWKLTISRCVLFFQDFDMNEAFGNVEIGNVDGVIELTARVYGPAAVHEFGLRVSGNKLSVELSKTI